MCQKIFLSYFLKHRKTVETHHKRHTFFTLMTVGQQKGNLRVLPANVYYGKFEHRQVSPTDFGEARSDTGQSTPLFDIYE